MAEPFLGEIRLFPYSQVPTGDGWALCNGQLLPINQNQALFSLLGTTFGGDGRVNFALPDLRGRVPIHVGSGPHARRAGRRAGAHAHRSPSCRTHTHVAAGDVGRPATRRSRRATCWRDSTQPALRRARQPDGARSRRRVDERGRQPGAPEHAAVPDAELLHRPAGHLPVARPEEPTPWHNPTSARSGCSPATSRPPAGCSARASCCRSPRTRRSSTLIGTTYGGDGESTFALPDLRGRIPIHQGNGFILAETGGAEEVTLTVNQIPAHTHPLLATTAVANQSSPANNVLAQSTAADLYIEDTATAALARQRDRARRRQPAAHELPAVPLHQLHHLAVRHLPAARPEERRHGRPVRRRDPDLPVQLRAQGLGVVQRPAPADLAEHRAVLAARHDLRRRRQVATSRCPTSRAARRCTPARARACRLHDLGETGGSRRP